MTKRSIRIAILHHSGGGNLGDDASVRSVIRSVQQRWPDAEFSAFTMNPEDSARRHGIPCYALRKYRWGAGYGRARDESGKGGLRKWLASTKNPLVRAPRFLLQEFLFLVRSFQSLRKFDLLLVSGGGQLTGRSGPWSFPYTLFIWMTLARVARVRSIFLNLGAGPLNDDLSRFFIRHALRAASYVSFRDEPSKALARSIGFSGPGEVFPDNVYSFPLASSSDIVDPRPHPIVGIGPMPYPLCDPRDFPHEDIHAIYNEYIGKVAAFAASLVKASCTIEIFGTDVGADPPAIEDLRRVLLERYRIETPPFRPIDSMEDLSARISNMDYVLTCRYHGVVFANLLNKPVLALPHHRKISDLMDSLGLADYYADIRKFQPEQLMDKFVSLVENTAAVKAIMETKLASNRSKLVEQYDMLFPPRPTTVSVPPVGVPGDRPAAVLAGDHRG